MPQSRRWSTTPVRGPDATDSATSPSRVRRRLSPRGSADPSSSQHTTLERHSLVSGQVTRTPVTLLATWERDILKSGANNTPGDTPGARHAFDSTEGSQTDGFHDFLGARHAVDSIEGSQTDGFHDFLGSLLDG